MMLEQRSANMPVGQTSEKADVLLISMPFSPLFHPSIALGLLKASLAPLDLSAKVLHFTLPFAELISTSLYISICEGDFAPFDLLGEWIFSGSLFGLPSLDIEGYIEDVLQGHSSPQRASRDDQEVARGVSVEDILGVRGRVDSFMNSCLDTALRYRPTVVGFTSVFQQQVASLAMAMRIKAQASQTFIVLGGAANCEGIMGAEVIRQFPFVDAVVSGEGDLVFPELVQRMLEGKPFSDLQGVYTQDNIDLICKSERLPSAPPVGNLDTLPFPDYDDFFQQLDTSRLDGSHVTKIPFQTSRGCWWGEKSHCTYCGFNGMTMSYRSKSADRALDELLYLTGRYPDGMILVVDNILDPKYFKDFIPELAARQLDLELYYEVKANLRKDQVRLLREAGVTRIQPGVESLSNPILKLMRKGTSALQNIQLLKWSKELGIRVYWNMLWGFPGESPEDYAHIAELIPFLTHLQPPNRAGLIRLDRFSPNFECAAELGFTDIAPFPSYHYLYPLAPEAVANLAYYFTFEYREPRDVEAYTKPVLEAVVSWQEVHKESELLLVDKGSDTPLLIWDLRPVAQDPLTVLAGLQRALYLACDSACTMRQLQKVAQEHAGERVSAQEIERLLRPLVERGLMLKEGNSYLALAVALGEYLPRRPVQEMVKPLL